MKILSFDFWGVGVTLNAHGALAEKSLEWLAEDFQYFQSSFICESEINFCLKGHAKSPNGIRLFSTKMCDVYGLGQGRACDYGDGTLVESQNRNGRRRDFTVYSPSENELYEFTYVALLSAVGEALDHKHFHRIHALGIGHGSLAYLLLLPPGGGKSTLAATFLKNEPALTLFSDESPLIKRAFVYPFPNRIALTSSLAQNFSSSKSRLFSRKYYASKVLLNVPEEKVSQPLRLGALLVGHRGKRRAEIRPLKKSRAAFELFKGVVVGDGLAQMAEFMLRGNNFFGLARIALSRFSEAMRLYKKVPCYEFIMSENIQENADTLKSFIIQDETKPMALPPKALEEPSVINPLRN